MTLDEAIKTYTSNAEYERNHGNLQGYLNFKQLVEWLIELKQLRNQESKHDIGVYEQEITDWSGAQGNTINREKEENERGHWGIYG